VPTICARKIEPRRARSIFFFAASPSTAASWSKKDAHDLLTDIDEFLRELADLSSRN
jgi:hypothetical protein